jgi:hypothetical protein
VVDKVEGRVAARAAIVAEDGLLPRSILGGQALYEGQGGPKRGGMGCEEGRRGKRLGSVGMHWGMQGLRLPPRLGSRLPCCRSAGDPEPTELERAETPAPSAQLCPSPQPCTRTSTRPHRLRAASRSSSSTRACPPAT